jgi:hypothetical protein
MSVNRKVTVPVGKAVGMGRPLQGNLESVLGTE